MSITDVNNYIKFKVLEYEYYKLINDDLWEYSVPNNPIESPIPSRLPRQHNRIQSIGSDSVGIADCNLPIATLTGVEDRGGGAASYVRTQLYL